MFLYKNKTCNNLLWLSVILVEPIKRRSHMKKYVTLFIGLFMVSACAAAPVRQVSVQGEGYYVSIGSFTRPRLHIHHPIVMRPIPPRRPRHIVHKPPRPPHHSHSVHPAHPAQPSHPTQPGHSSQPSHPSQPSPLRG